MVALLSSQSGASIRFRFAVNSAGLDKDWDFKLLASQYRDREGTIHDVARHVKAGHALCAGLLGGKWRAKSNVIGSQWILLDIDNSGLDANGEKCYQHQLTLDEALEHPFIKKYCALIYTTASHKPDWHKFRLVFLLPEFVPGYEAVEVLTRYLMQHLPHDPACKDASRVFYGNTEATFPLIQPESTLPAEWIIEAQATAELDLIEYQQRIAEIEKRRKEIRERTEAQGWNVDELIQQALDYIPPRSPGAGNYQECISVLMALVNHYGSAEAEIIAERWSPSIPGSTWNISQKIRSLREGRSGGITIGTLFHIAKQYGFRFPTPTSTRDFEVKSSKEKLPAAADGYRWWDDITYWLGRFTQRFRKLAIGFAPKEEPSRTYKQPKEILFVPGKLPTFEEYLVMGNPKIIYGSGQRITCWEEMSAKGYKVILDESMTGQGKSHDAGLVEPEQLEVEQLFYVSEDHRNPTVATVEANYTDLPVRHNGLTTDFTRLTALGNPNIRWAKPGEEKDVDANCFRAGVFHALASKGYQPDVNQSAKDNPVCRTCHLRTVCAGRDVSGKPIETAPGASFRHDRAFALASPKVRAHIDSIPDIFAYKLRTAIATAHKQLLEAKTCELDVKAGKNTPIEELEAQVQQEIEDRIPEITETVRQETKIGIIVDEAMRQFNSEDLTLVDSREFDRGVAELVSKLPEIWETIKSLILPLRPLLTGETPQKGDTFYGWSDTSLRDIVGEIPANLASIADQIDAATKPNLDEVLREVGVDYSTVSRRDRALGAIGRANAALRRQEYREIQEKVASLPIRWAAPLLQVLSGELAGALRVTDRRLMIATRNNHQLAILSQMNIAIFMDATASREGLALHLNVNPNEIALCKQEPIATSNLKIIQITGLGLLGKQRSENLSGRVDALKAKLKEMHPDLRVIDHLKFKSDQSEGHWFKDNRGSNEFLECSAILSFGTPYPDIGQLQLEYSTLTGDRDTTKENPAFQSFVKERVEAEIVQWGGRLRANRRPDEQLTCYIATELDLSFLAQYYSGAEITSVRAVDIYPEAGTDVERNFNAIAFAFKELTEQEAKITVEAIAQKIGVTKGRVSQMAKEHFGNWKGLRTCLISLLKALYSKIKQTKNVSPPSIDPDLLWTAQTYFPLLLAEATEGGDLLPQVNEILQVYGVDNFALICDLMSPDILLEYILHLTMKYHLIV